MCIKVRYTSTYIHVISTYRQKALLKSHFHPSEVNSIKLCMIKFVNSESRCRWFSQLPIATVSFANIKVWRYQSGSENRLTEGEQTIQWPKRKMSKRQMMVHKILHRKDRATRTLLSMTWCRSVGFSEYSGFIYQ